MARNANMLNTDKQTFMRAIRFRQLVTVTLHVRGGLETTYFKGAKPVARQFRIGKAWTFQVAPDLINAS